MTASDRGRRGAEADPAEAQRMLELYERISQRRRRERSLWRSAAPIVVSIAAHLVLLALTAVVAWQVTIAGAPRGRETIVSFDDPTFGSPPPPPPAPEPPTQRPLSLKETMDAPAAAARPDLRQLAAQGAADAAEAEPDSGELSGVDPFASRPLLSGEEEAAAAVEPVLADVRFVGVGAGNARSVVYVIDASGPMVSTLPLVKERVLQSVDRLRPTQRFGVVAFRQYDALRAGGPGGASGGAESFAPRLVRATTGAKTRLREWLDDVDARGRSAPLEGLRQGLSLHPDAIFLLSRGIERSGGGLWGQGLEATLAELDRLNPADRNGLRPTTIKTIQFLDEDPTGIMRAIARQHALDAADGYTIIESVQALEKRR